VNVSPGILSCPAEVVITSGLLWKGFIFSITAGVSFPLMVPIAVIMIHAESRAAAQMRIMPIRVRVAAPGLCSDKCSAVLKSCIIVSF